ITRRAVTSEALVLGAKAGLKTNVMLDVFRQTAASNAHLQMTYPGKALKGDFSPMFMVDLAHKDLSVALMLGASQQVPLALGAVAREMFTSARARGRGKLDWTAVITVLEDEAGGKGRDARGLGNESCRRSGPVLPDHRRRPRHRPRHRSRLRGSGRPGGGR